MRLVCFVATLLIASCASAQERISDVVYYKLSGSACTMDVFKPKTPNHKAVLMIRSFGWYSSEDEDGELAKSFTDRGFTYFSVTHGSQPNFTIPEIIPMLERAVRFVRANASTYGIDPAAIGVFGANTGGMLALEIGGLADDGYSVSKDPVERVSDRANAIVALFPPTDLENWGAKGVSPLDLDVTRWWLGAFGNKEAVKEIAHDISPIRLVNRGYPATLLIHGDADKTVPIQQSRSFDSALASANVVHKLVVIPGGGQDDTTFEKGMPEVLNWFEVHLTAAK